MPIAIQETLLPGSSQSEKFRQAQAFGAAGIEVSGVDLTEHVPAIVEAMIETNLPIAAVNHGHQADLLAADRAERERALSQLRQSIVNACDLGAPGVIFVPHYGDASLPDLSPWLSAAELETELMYTHLRTLEDFGEALGIDLYIEPISRYETHLFNRIEQVAVVARRLNHPRVKIAANLFHMALEEHDLLAALRDHADLIGYVHLADTNHRLPGQGFMDFAAAAETLREIGYSGWLAYDCNPSSSSDLAASLAHLAQAGLS